MPGLFFCAAKSDIVDTALTELLRARGRELRYEQPVTVFAPFLPWQNRQGRLCPFRVAALIVAVLPALWIGLQAAMGWLAPRSLANAVHQAGDWSIRLLILTLLVTPARRIIDAPRLINARQVLGLASFAYLLGHVLLHLANLKFNVPLFTTELFLRIYLGIGCVAAIGLSILAAQSGAGGVRRLGTEGWQRLHKAVYLIAPLGLLHFYIQSKLDVSEPLLLSGFYLWLMGWRWLDRHRRSAAPGLAALSIAAALATGALEVLWFGLVNGVPATNVVAANLDFSFETRPMWIVLAAGLCATLLQALRGRSPRRTPGDKT